MYQFSYLIPSSLVVASKKPGCTAVPFGCPLGIYRFVGSPKAARYPLVNIQTAIETENGHL
jgi:hypothetical protein